MSNLISVAVAEVGAKLLPMKNASVEEKLRAAMELMKSHWCVTNPDDRLRAAIIGTIGSYKDTSHPDALRLIAEAKFLGRLSGAIEYGLAFEVDDDTLATVTNNPVQILKIWEEVTNG